MVAGVPDLVGGLLVRHPHTHHVGSRRRERVSRRTAHGAARGVGAQHRCPGEDRHEQPLGLALQPGHERVAGHRGHVREDRLLPGGGPRQRFRAASCGPPAQQGEGALRDGQLQGGPQQRVGHDEHRTAHGQSRNGGAQLHPRQGPPLVGGLQGAHVEQPQGAETRSERHGKHLEELAPVLQGPVGAQEKHEPHEDRERQHGHDRAVAVHDPHATGFGEHADHREPGAGVDGHLDGRVAQRDHVVDAHVVRVGERREGQDDQRRGHPGQGPLDEGLDLVQHAGSLATPATCARCRRA